MADKRDAYSVLGLRQGAGKDEIIKRYDILMKKHRNKEEHSGEVVDQSSLEDINRAYNMLMGYESVSNAGEQSSEDKDKKSNPVLNKMNIDGKKVENFFYYYKFHVIVGAVLLLLAGYTVYNLVTHVKPDLNIAFIGDYPIIETEDMEKQLLSYMPEMKRIQITIITMSDTLKGQFAQGMQMKLMATMASGDADVYILDRANFGRWAKEGGFSSLDNAAGSAGIPKEKTEAYVLVPKGENSKHLYGIDVSDNKIVKDMKVSENEKIIALSSNGKHQENARKFLNMLLSNKQ